MQTDIIIILMHARTVLVNFLLPVNPEVIVMFSPQFNYMNLCITTPTGLLTCGQSTDGYSQPGLFGAPDNKMHIFQTQV